MANLLFELNQHIEILATELKDKYGLNFHPTVRNQFLSVDILLTDTTYPYGDDWMPQMSITILFSENKIILNSLRLPKDLQNRGIGTHCCYWLLELCKKYKIQEIHGEAIESSKGYWEKVGCTHKAKHTVYQVKSE